ncbi:MAG: hypothetical protein IJJ40_01155 [Clostridia bacterium]|nr:hypothetical protein [Clostridia bacterium]
MIKLKKLYIIPIIVVLTLCGCKSKSEPKKINDISFLCHVEIGDKEYKINSTIDNNGNFNGSVVYPESIKGLEIAANGDTATFTFMGVKYEQDLKKYPVSAITSVIYSAFNDDSNKQKDEIKGKIGNVDYTLTLKDGLPYELTAEKLKLKAEISDIKINGE